MDLLLQQLQMASPTVTSGLFLHAVSQLAVAKPCPTMLQHIAHEPTAAAAQRASPMIISGLFLYAISQLAVAKPCSLLQQLRRSAATDFE